MFEEEKKTGIGMALEGGGSRGAYQVGVMKAFLEAGYCFDGYAGTSIGAINAAAFAQGDFQKTLDMWSSVTTEQLFDADTYKLLKIGEAKWDMQLLTEARVGLKKIIDEHGVDTSRIREMINECIDEKKIRESGCDFGLVTVSTNERKPYELFLEDIPQGELNLYIEASSCLPGFQPLVIGKNSYLDGGLYNNCPTNMLIRKGYKEIVVVRTKAPGVYRYFTIPKDVKIKMVVPKNDLGNIMIFSPKKIMENIETGYQDGLKALSV